MTDRRSTAPAGLVYCVSDGYVHLARAACPHHLHVRERDGQRQVLGTLPVRAYHEIVSDDGIELRGKEAPDA